MGLTRVAQATGVVDSAFWSGKRVLVTGHNGFKGSWLSLWLQELGADVHGLALAPPTTPALFIEANVGAGMTSVLGDVGSYQTVAEAFRGARPEIVFHLAAQAIVRDSYADPLGTYATNIMGSAHVLEAARNSPDLRVLVVVTTDKVYENSGGMHEYGEDDPFGGFDPYSSSKAAVEIVTSAYRQSFLREADVAVATARAGNVIGGGDWASDRLVPDILRALQANQPVRIRNPQAIRPWQHVLEPVSGYLRLAERLWAEGDAVAEGWNFGPLDSDVKPVSWIVDELLGHWPGNSGWRADPGPHPHEAAYLSLNVAKARRRLGWEPHWELGTALWKVATWHRAWLAGDDVRQVVLDQISEFTNL
jgi:CDP-glucose 4,6-dehydratase